MDQSVEKIYGNRVRTRVCGLCRQGEKLLLVNHHGVYGHDFWAPPGGGIEFGVSITDNLVREFQEETGLDVRIGEFRFGCEFIMPPLHAIELFFDVTVTGGLLTVGHDPEMVDGKQVITAAQFLSPGEIDSLPEKHKHGLFKAAKTAQKVSDLRGYLKI